MRIYVLRHGIAEDVAPGGSDAERALTPEGKRKLRAVLAQARCAGIHPDLVVSSPLKRAVETAEIAAAVLSVESPRIRSAALVPSGSSDRVWKEIRSRHEESVLIAGHEPLLSNLVSFLLGCPALLVRMKKAALVALEVDRESPQPRGILLWMLTPKLAAD